jgi:predicted small integral membrane protein
VTAETQEPAPEETVEQRRARARARTEAKNQAVRETLEPLEPGERPLAVTIAAVVAALAAIGNVAAFALRDHPPSAQRNTEIFWTIVTAGVLGVASWGMWRAKYWAVLGFQTLLGLQIIIATLSILRASKPLAALVFLAIVLASAVLFWYLVRAMARIQMPEAPEVKSLREQREEAEEAARAEAATNASEQAPEKEQEAEEKDG